MGRAPPLAFLFSAFPPPPAGKGQIPAAARPRPAPPGPAPDSQKEHGRRGWRGESEVGRTGEGQ